MTYSVSVRAMPQVYLSEVGVLQKLPKLLVERDLKRILIVHGEKSLTAAKRFLPDLLRNTTHYDHYSGECTYDEIARITDKAINLNVDAIIGIGGGKVMDLVKAAAFKTDLPEVLIPTLAATCAGFTPLSVIYDEQGKMLTYEVYTRTPSLVLIEQEILLEAPIDFLIAGIGDALAKWYEGIILLEGVKQDSAPLELSYYTAQLCRERLLKFSEQAIEDSKFHRLSEAFLKIIETNIFLAGLVGGLGERFAKTVGAHAIYNAATTLPQTHSVLHGKQVAYGILVQLALENKQDEIIQLLPFYLKTQLPSTLSDINSDFGNKEDVIHLAKEAASPSSSIHHLLMDISVDKVIQAIEVVEKLAIATNHK